ncbi:hypothetical protein [Streptomyces sp. NPDC005009]
MERKAADPVRAAETRHLHGHAYDTDDPKGGDNTVRGGMFTYLGW